MVDQLPGDDDDLDRAMNEIGRLMREIEHCSRQDVPPPTYYQQVLPRAMQALGPDGELLDFTRVIPSAFREPMGPAESPGDRVFIVAKMLEMSRRGARAATQAVVRGKLVYEGQVLAIVT